MFKGNSKSIINSMLTRIGITMCTVESFLQFRGIFQKILLYILK